MVFGGITTFAKLATFQRSTWPAVQQAALKWRPSVPLHTFNVTLLLAISLWTLVDIVLGDKADVSSITKEEIAIVAERDICEDDEDPAAKLPKLKSIK